jgi:hypothetical protein
MARSAFFSFHYQRDAWRVQQVINMGKLEGQPLLSAQKWEEVKRRGDQAIKNWIEEQMKYKSAVVVLVGAQTAQRRWVKHEIAYAWNNRKPILGIRIHGLADRNGYTDTQGPDPFTMVNLKGGGTVADYVSLHNPIGSTSQQAYASIDNNLFSWVDSAYKRS